MKRKAYMAPAAEVVGYTVAEEFLNVSGDVGIDSGGVDDLGTKDPASRIFEGFGFENENPLNLIMGQ